MMETVTGGSALEILLVEDNPGDALLVIELIREIEGEAVGVRHVTRLGEALRALEDADFDAVLLDLSLPDAFGVATVQQIRASSPHVPIVVLSGGDERLAIEAVHEGAEDYVPKMEIAGARLMRALRYAIERHARMHRMAFYDQLTHLPNRALFRDRVARAILRGRRDGDVCAVLFVDLDGFKRINDTFGHDAGDDVLRGVARRMRTALRTTDVAARYGGDEFVVLLPSLRRPEDALIVAEKLRSAIAQPRTVAGRELSVGASIGIALHPRDGADVDGLLLFADAAMYAKKSDKKVVIALAG
jgi:two-component system cell cycle response regulator